MYAELIEILNKQKELQELMEKHVTDINKRLDKIEKTLDNINMSL